MALENNKKKNQQMFLEAYRKHHNISKTAKALGMSFVTFYKWKKEDPGFLAQFEQVKEEMLDILEDAVYERGKTKSDILAMFFLKAHRPKYRDKQEVEHTGNISVSLNMVLQKDGKED